MRPTILLRIGTFASIVAILGTAARLHAEEPKILRLTVRTQELRQNDWGGNYWHVVETPRELPAGETALLLCDVWDQHWSRGATRRVGEMAPRMNEVVRAARAMGVFIIHAPSGTMDFYKDAPARKRMIEAPQVAMPPAQDHDDPPHPIDASDQGSDTPDDKPHKAWSRQHPAIEIDQDTDGVSDNGQEVWNAMQERGIKNLIIMGVHTNMCVLGRSFAI